MRKKQLDISSFFQVSEVLFYFTNFFIFLGLAHATIRDIQLLFFPIGLADIIVLVILVVQFLMVLAGRLDRNRSIGILLVLSVFLFQMTAVVLGGLEGTNIDLQIVLSIMMSLLFSSLAAFTVSKGMSLFIGGWTLLFYIGTTLLFRTPRMVSEMVFYPIIIIGYTLAMYYFHLSLEKLASGLYQSYDVVKQQKLELKSLKDVADKVNEDNRPFVTFGRNTSQLIHDFKNDISVIETYCQMFEMKLDRDQAVGREEVHRLRAGIARLNDRMENVKFITSATEDRSDEEISVPKLIRSVVYNFRLIPSIKKNIVFVENIKTDGVIFGSRFQLVRILENLIRNSCEAISDSLYSTSDDDEAPMSIDALLADSAERGTVTVSSRQISDNALLFSVEDNGPGFDSCKNCGSVNCLSCDKFKVGVTTKSYGSGFGIVGVKEIVRKMQGHMRIQSGRESGALVEVVLPMNPTHPIDSRMLASRGFVK